ncbi:MAG: transglycosylase domain-containing protein, partial [Anaerolineales bacterium]|nr:transglycosylase domain-containing protein [Anaerolineales bacterium]
MPSSLKPATSKTKPPVTARGLGLAFARLATIATITAIVVACVMIVGAISAYAYFAQALPPPELLAGYAPAQSTKIYDRTGELLFEAFDPNAGKRTVVPISKIPLVLKQATIATEDPSFYSNTGIDPRGIARAT